MIFVGRMVRPARTEEPAMNDILTIVIVSALLLIGLAVSHPRRKSGRPGRRANPGRNPA